MPAAIEQLGAKVTFIDQGRETGMAQKFSAGLDYPGIGLIRVSNLPVVETLAAMR